MALLIIMSCIEELDAAERMRNRDPFKSLSEKTEEEPATVATVDRSVQRPAGLKGIRIDEASLVGIVFSGESRFALLTADEASFTCIAEVGSKLFDGSVLQILDSGILFAQDTDTSDRSSTVFKPLLGESAQ